MGRDKTRRLLRRGYITARYCKIDLCSRDLRPASRAVTTCDGRALSSFGLGYQRKKGQKFQTIFFTGKATV